MKEIVNLNDCSKYFYEEQLSQIMDYIEDVVKKSDFIKDLSENYELFENNERIYIGLLCFSNIDLINGMAKDATVEYKVELKFGIPAISILRITLYDKVDDHFLDKIIDYKEILNQND